MLHEVLTGRRLFKGQNDVQTIERVRRCDVPPPSLQNPAVPPELDHIVLKALQRDPARRWSNAADMADALDDIVHAARFQPTHLQQILYDLFPPEGGAPAPRTGSQRIAVARLDRGRRRRLASRTVPPVVAHGVGRAPRCRSTPRAGARQSLKPKSKLPSALLALVVLGGGGLRRLEVPRRPPAPSTSASTHGERSGAPVPRLREVEPRGRGHLSWATASGRSARRR